MSAAPVPQVLGLGLRHATEHTLAKKPSRGRLLAIGLCVLCSAVSALVPSASIEGLINMLSSAVIVTQDWVWSEHIPHGGLVELPIETSNKNVDAATVVFSDISTTEATCGFTGPEDTSHERKLMQVGSGTLHPFGVANGQRNDTLLEVEIQDTSLNGDHETFGKGSLLQDFSYAGVTVSAQSNPIAAIGIVLIGVIIAAAVFVTVFLFSHSPHSNEEDKAQREPFRGGPKSRDRSSSPFMRGGQMSHFFSGRRESPRDSLPGAGTSSHFITGPGASQGLALQFCAGLVVPSGHECLLAVPVFRPRVGMGRQPASFEVRDLEGKELIQAEVPAWAAGGGSIGQFASVVLRSSSTSESQPLSHLAHCKADLDMGGLPKAEFFNAHGQLFATMAKASPQQVQRLWPNQGQFSDPSMPSYVLTAAAGAGAQLLFSGNFDEHAVRVVNDRSEQLADTEPAQMRFDPAGTYYKLRVASNTDVGLVLCGLLLITQMETLWGRASA
mmetsp:Transcript_11265/g.25653  ORF Transcript_11265/g.25653 Transcript_11265/m.25653 type:complete len:499 (+) Transcript_11265:165-1661(+)